MLLAYGSPLVSSTSGFVLVDATAGGAACCWLSHQGEVGGGEGEGISIGFSSTRGFVLVLASVAVEAVCIRSNHHGMGVGGGGGEVGGDTVGASVSRHQALHARMVGGGGGVADGGGGVEGTSSFGHHQHESLVTGCAEVTDKTLKIARCKSFMTFPLDYSPTFSLVEHSRTRLPCRWVYEVEKINAKT